jgi:hypothetical protein
MCLLLYDKVTLPSYGDSPIQIETDLENKRRHTTCQFQIIWLAHPYSTILAVTLYSQCPSGEF